MMTYNLSRLGRLIRKELSEILRDRRTIVTLVLMPILLYPLLSVAFQQFFLASRLTPGQQVEYHLGFVAEEDAQALSDRIDFGEHVMQARREATEKKAQQPTAEPPSLKAKVGTYEELEADLRAGKIDAIIRTLPKPASVEGGEQGNSPPRPDRAQMLDFEFVFVPTSPGGQGALSYLEQRLAAANEVEFVDLLRRLNKSAVRVRSQVVRLLKTPLEGTAGGGSLISLASLVPLILILMTITGAVYPAIDLTAGERERGTLEILVAAPVPRLGLLFAKYVSVVTVAILTGLVNLVAMTMTLVFSGLGPVLFPNQGFSPVTIVQVFGLLLLFAAFFSAVLLCITSFARSFKEAQAYLIPLMLVSLAPGVMGMTPGLKLADWAVVPLVNIVLLGRDLFEGGADLGPALVVIVTTLAYALAAIALAARIFGAESVLYSEQSSWGDLLRRPSESTDYAPASAALWCWALMIPLNFVLHGSALLLKQSNLLSEQLQVVMLLAYSLVVFGAWPALFAWRGHLRIVSGFALFPARWSALAGGIALGLSLWPLLFWPLSFLSENVLLGRNPDIVQQIIEFYGRLTTVEKLLLAVVPAVVEEWFFRGYLYGAVRQRTGAAASILVTALLFGITHYIQNPHMGEMRQLPAALMGLVLGTMRETSGSLWPGMLLHATHNSILVLLLQAGEDQTTTIEPWWIAAGAVGSALGAGLTWLGRGAAGRRR